MTIVAIGIALYGFGYVNIIVALVILAFPLVLTNTFTAVEGVDPGTVEAARGMGMSRATTLLRVELPLAWPVVLAGVRTSTQMVMGIAAIAAYVLGPGLGGFIFTGLSRLGGANALNSALTGTIAVVLLALVLDLLLVAVGRLTTPRGIRV